MNPLDVLRSVNAAAIARGEPVITEQRAIHDSDYVCNVWFERDRKQVCLASPDGREIFTLTDEDVDQAIEDGYLPVPRTPRPRDSDWQPCAVTYAREKGLI